MSFLNMAAYRFVSLNALPDLQTAVRQALDGSGIRGTVLLAEEGINLFLAGEAAAVHQFLDWLRTDSRFAALEAKESWSETQPFKKLLVKIKPEIIRMNHPAIAPARGRAPAVDAATLKRWLDQGMDDRGQSVVTLDTRNAFEADCGTFTGAIDWRIDKFTEFPAAFAAHRAALQGKTVVSFCTGGIRCEKAAILMREAGLTDVYQLDGGILKYFEEVGQAHYTGGCFVFDERRVVDASLAARPELVSAALSPLAQRYARVRQQTLDLSAPLSAEDCQLQSMPDASPAKWHLAHVTWFFETFLLERFEPGFQPFDASFRVLFNSYYNGVGDKHPRHQRGQISRPTLAEVMRYRRQVDARMHTLIGSVHRLAADEQTALGTLLELGLQHEQQHQELLLTDIQHALSLNPARPAYALQKLPAGTPSQALRWLPHAGGLVQHGHLPALDGDFAFDNETPRHPTYVAPFEIGHRPVNNGDFMAFIADGGYRRPELWLAMGWDWVQHGAVAGEERLPLYWRGTAGDLRHFTLHGEIPVDPAAPACHLSYFEADAYARWAGARLPTEQEWELAARTHATAPQGNLLESGHFQPVSPPESAREGRLSQLWGDVWEWTQSSYNAYPGYRPWEGLVGEYNGKFMCQQYVLRGGSCATPQSHLRASYRNFFPPGAQWQFSGLRLARDLPDALTP